ncbi:hypothetical protein [Aestuariirhabdus sp. LZHN29]|uniref:hypothetical protein n=1 Tax=Aestuariirhabdus sp. LZHN29 TaxID=3417462 RepID=UPI003CEB0677
MLKGSITETLSMSHYRCLALLLACLMISFRTHAAESPAVKDFRFPLPGDAPAAATVSPITEPVTPPSQDIKPPAELQPGSPVVDSIGAQRGQSDSMGQAIAPGGKVLGNVDSLGRVIEPGTGAIRGQVPSAGQPARPFVK